MQTKRLRSLTLVLLATLGIAACDNDSTATLPPPPPPPPPPTAEFAVTVMNATNAQPLSPIAVIAHTEGYSVFSVGDPATTGLEEMAEGGDNSALLAEANGDASVITSASGAAPIGPAGSETVNVTVNAADRLGMQISVATMLVNTNDAFTALNSLPIQAMAVR